jgi:hypothetical protein
MRYLFKLLLSPFALLFRVSFANPVAAILASGAAGLGAFMIGQLNWMAVLLCFSSFVIIYWSESEARATAVVAAAD